MRVLVNDEDDLLTVVEAEEVGMASFIASDEDCSIDCPCLYVISSNFEIYIPMSHSNARELVLEAYANNYVDLSAYNSRTYFNPDKDDIEELEKLIANKSLRL